VRGAYIAQHERLFGVPTAVLGSITVSRGKNCPDW